MTTDVLNLTLVEVSKKIIKKEISSEELVKLSIESSKKWNPIINAFIKINEDNAVTAAHKSRSSSQQRKPFRYIAWNSSSSQRSFFILKGQPITCGSKVLNGYVSSMTLQ